MKIAYKVLITIWGFTLINCSHISSLESASKYDFLQSINDKLANEDVIVYTSENQKFEGQLVRINDALLVLDCSGNNMELNTDKIDSLKYRGDSIVGGVAVGGILGFFLGYAITEFGDVRLGFGGGSNNAELILAIPALMVVGGIIGGIAAAHKTRTIYFKY
jgi:hypothetical protein